MKTPGFTADASIYRNKGQYKMVRSPSSLSGRSSLYQAGSIQPAALSAACWSNCYCCGKIGNSGCCQKCDECT